MRGRGMAFLVGRAAGKNAAAQQTTSASNSSMAELEELTSLHDKGALTDEEFASAKKKVLSAK